MKNRKIKKIVTTCVICLLALWSAYYFGFRKLIKLQTQQAEFDTINDVIETVGIVIRDEVVLEDSKINANNLKYLFSDGEKVSKNSTLAEVYSNSEEAKASYKIDALDKEIKILEKLNFSKNNMSKGINFINNQVNDGIKNLLTSIGDSNVLESEKNKQNLIYLLNEKQVILGKDINLNQRIETLQNEKNKLTSLLSSNAALISSPESGDFVRYIDGYENIADYKNIKKVKFDDLSNACASVNNRKENNCFGKILKSETWYAVCSITEDEAKRISSVGEAKINIPYSDFSASIPCKIESVVKDSNSENYTLVISCDYMNKDFALLRKENFKIDLGEYSGLKVNKDAVRKYSDENGVFQSGVYIESGGHLKFKKINPIFVKSSEVICSYNSEQAADEKYLQPGDFVVVAGTDLYENKRLG